MANQLLKRKPGYSEVGNFVARGANRVDPALRDILRNAAQSSGMAVEVYSGYRPPSKKQGSFHPKGVAADIRLIDPNTGQMLDNYQDAKTFRAYEQFAQKARQYQQEKYPELNNKFRWGGYFSGPPGQYGAIDLMHFDLGGANMAGGSWEGGLTTKQRQYLPGVQSVGLASRPRPGRIEQSIAPVNALMGGAGPSRGKAAPSAPPYAVMASADPAQIPEMPQFTPASAPARGNALLGLRDGVSRAFPNGLTGLRGVISDPNWKPSGLIGGFGLFDRDQARAQPLPRPMVGPEPELAPPVPGETDEIETKALPIVPGTASPAASGQTAVEKELALPEQVPGPEFPQIPMTPIPGRANPIVAPLVPRTPIPGGVAQAKVTPKAPEPPVSGVAEEPPVPGEHLVPPVLRKEADLATDLVVTPAGGPVQTFDEAFKDFEKELTTPGTGAILSTPESDFDKALREEFGQPAAAAAAPAPTIDPALMDFYDPTPSATGKRSRSWAPNSPEVTDQAKDYARQAAAKDGVAQPGVLQTPDGAMSWSSEQAKQDYYLNKTKALTSSQYLANAVGLGLPQAIFGDVETKRQLENYETQQPGNSAFIHTVAPILPVTGLYGAGAKALGYGARELGRMAPKIEPAVNALGRFFSGNAGKDATGLPGYATRGASYVGAGATEGATSGALLSQLSDYDMQRDAAMGGAVYATGKAIGGPIGRMFTNPAMKAENTAKPGMVESIYDAAPYFSEKTFPDGGQITTDPLTQRVDYNLNSARNQEQLDSWTTDLARHVGMKDNHITKKTLGEHENVIGQKLDKIATKGGIVAHKEILDALTNHRAEVQRAFKNNVDANGQPLLESDAVYIVNEIDKLQDMIKNVAMDGTQFRAQTDRSSIIGRMISSNNSHHKFHGSKLRDILEDGYLHTATKAGIPGLPDELKKTLQQYRNTQVLYDAASASGSSGVIGPKQFKDAFEANYTTKYVPNKNNPISYGLNIADVLPDVTPTGAAVGKVTQAHPDNPTLALANRGAAPTIHGYGNTAFDSAKQWLSPALLAYGGAVGMGAGNWGTLGMFGATAAATAGYDKLRDRAIAEIMRTPEYRNLIMGVGKRSDIPLTNTERWLHRGGNALLPAATAGMSYDRRKE